LSPTTESFQEPGESLNQDFTFKEKTMPEAKYAGQVRDVERSIQETAGLYGESMDLFKRGVERTIESQRQFLDIADQQNADTANLWRQMFGNIPGVEQFCNLAERTVDQFIQFQRMTLDAIGQQSGEVAESAKQQGERAARVGRETVESAERHRERIKSA